MSDIVKIQPKPPMSTAKKAGIAAALAAAAVASTPFIAKWEGKRNYGYLDIVKVPTYCYGGTGPEAVVGKYYSDAACKEQLVQDAIEHAKPLQNCITRELPGPVFQSVISLSFNMGSAGVCKTAAYRPSKPISGQGTVWLLNNGYLVEGCKSLGRYVYAKGKVVNGLVNRRKDEIKLCLSGVE